VNEVETPKVADSPETAENLLRINNLILSVLDRIDNLQKEINSKKEMVEDAYEGNPTYKEQADKAKDIIKEKAVAKQQILANPELTKNVLKIKDDMLELKELRNTLSDYLVEYARLSGARTIEDNKGKLRQIAYSAKLVKSPDKK